MLRLNGCHESFPSCFAWPRDSSVGRNPTASTMSGFGVVIPRPLLLRLGTWHKRQISMLRTRLPPWPSNHSWQLAHLSLFLTVRRTSSPPRQYYRRCMQGIIGCTVAGDIDGIITLQANSSHLGACREGVVQRCSAGAARTNHRTGSSCGNVRNAHGERLGRRLTKIIIISRCSHPILLVQPRPAESSVSPNILPVDWSRQADCHQQLS